MKKHKKTSRIELNLGGNVQFKFNLYIIICTYVCLYLCQIYKCANEWLLISFDKNRSKIKFIVTLVKLTRNHSKVKIFRATHDQNGNSNDVATKSV